MNKSLYFSIILAFIVFHTPVKSQSNFALGADVSWLTEQEKYSRKFYTSEGQQKECMQLLKENTGMNAIRLRVWVNPTDVWNGLQDVLVKAKRANALGMRLMIDFHYSDTWADPSHQTKPVAWTAYTLDELKSAVATHTTLVLDSLKKYGITPEWVQVGNETSNGMLWETGKASVNMYNFAQLVNSGYNAVKSVFPNTKVIVHLNNGYDNSLFRWIFDGLKSYGGKWDVIGMSLYPSWYKTANDWTNANIDCLANMNDMVSRYGKEVMIVECGMSWDNASTCKSFLTDLISKTKSVTGGKGTGVFYWEPQSYGQWKAYTLGAFDNSGKPTIALDAFKLASEITEVAEDKSFYKWDSAIHQLSFTRPVSRMNIYDSKGKLLFSEINIQKYQNTELKNGVFLLEVITESSERKASKLIF